MKNLLTVLLLANLALFSGSAYATNYYFSSTDGDDSRSSAEAQNSSTPWKTISKLNSIISTLQPGDQILFKRGDFFYGSIIASKAGTSSQRITFSAYGSGAKPVITGLTQVTAWTNAGGSIWQSTNAVSSLGTTNIVVINGANTPMGRTPNSGSNYSISSHSSSSVTIGALSSSVNYKGAEVVFRTGASWIMSRNLITSQSGTTLNFVRNYPNPFNFTIYDPANGPAFIQNSLATLDAQNEWYYDPSTKKLSVYSGSTPSGVNMATIDSLVKITAGYLTFDNLEFRGANTDCFQLSSASNITIQNCDVKYVGDNAVQQMNGNPNLTVTNCTFRDVQNSGITNVGYSNNSGVNITGNSFSSINMIPGAFGSLDGTNLVIGIYDPGTNDLIQNNSIDSCGYIGISDMGSTFTIKNNFVNHFCFFNTDGAGIYTGNHGTSRTISGNVVLNGMTGAAHGIYVDDNGSNITITGNTVYKAILGIYLHNAHEITVQSNTVYACTGASLSMGHDANDAVRNVSVSQNIFVLAASVSQGNCSYQTSETSQTNFGTSDNNYICKPIGTDDNAWFTALQASTFNHYTLSQWQSMSSFDKSSKKSPKTITDLKDLRFEYNATTSNKTVNLGATYMDMSGKNYAGSITLAPYTSAVLIYGSGTVANQLPVANAGQDQNLSLPTNTTTLVGSGSDPDGTISSYLWTKVSGPTQFAIASPTLAKTGISNLAEGVYQFELKVTDNSGASAVDTVSITVTATSNQAPIARAGNSQSITLPTNAVSVDGSSSSDPDGTIASYQWTRVLGPSSAVIVNPNQATTDITSLVQGTYQFELKVTDNLGAVGKDTVQVTVGGAPNQSPIANAGLDVNVTLPTNNLTLTGSGVDLDGTIAVYQWSEVSGPSQYAILSPTQSSTLVNNLVAGIYQFQLMVTDNLGATSVDVVQVTVNTAPNQSPTADAGLDINLTLPTNNVTLSGSGADADGTIASYQWSEVSGPSQSTILSPGKSSTSVNNLIEGIYNFELTVTDNLGATSVDVVQVIVNPAPNQSPTANAGVDINITLPTNSTMLSGSGVDPDGSIVDYQWSKISGPAQYTISSPTKAATSIGNLAEGIYEFQLQVTDNSGAVATDIVLVTVNGASPQPNQNPDANAGSDLSITLPTNSVTLAGSGSDPDGTIASYQWTMMSGPSQYSIASPTQAGTAVSNLTEGVYEFQLQVTDNAGATSVDVVQITVDAAPIPNQSPSASAGADIVLTLPTNSATLSGTATDPDGWMTSYRWKKISGPSQYNISSPNTAQTSVTSLAKGAYAFELTATDNTGATAKDTVQITVNAAPNQSPTAYAGADINITLPTSSASLSGAGIDPDGTIASYRWAKIAGPTQYTIVSPGAAKTSVTNLAQGSYSFELTVTDNSGASAKDTVEVNVNAAVAKPNQMPEANAGNDVQITLPTNSTRLSGIGTDPDGKISSYRWRSISGPKEFTINSPTRSSTTVSNLVQGIYNFELMVTDNAGATDRDTVAVTVMAAPSNQAPKANAGSDVNITLPTNSTSLSGSGADPDGTIASYKWVKVAGPSQYSIGSSSSAQTSVTNLAQGVYQFELTVTDNAGKTAKDTMQVTVNAAVAVPNQAPKANAGSDVNITLPTNSTSLSGSGTDPDGTIASYKWVKVAGPSQYSIGSSTKAQTSVTNLAQGVYQFELTVTDNGGKTAKDTMQVTVNAAPPAPNQAPTANAGLDINVTLPTNSVILSGSGNDPDGTIVSYLWNKVSGPSDYAFVSATQAGTTVNNLAEGTYEFELTVTDNGGKTAKDTVQVIVNPVSLSANHVPTADAGTNIDITLPTNSVKLTGKGNDIDGTVTSYKWKKSSGPTQYNIASSNTAETEVTGLVEGVYQFELTVTDNSNAAGRSTMEVTVHAAPNQLPTADAGSDLQISLPTDTATLTGAGTDPDGTVASYKWTEISGPGLSSVVSPSKSQTLIDNLTEGIYQFELTVTDNAGASSKDTVQVTVLAVPKAFAKLFPNPATSTINIQIEGAGRTSSTAMRIYDNKGILVYQEDFVRPPQPMIKQVNVSKLSAGIYFVELQTDTNNITTLRFMKK